jgi:hypothetical protein
MTVSHTTASRVLQNVHHGGRVLPDAAPQAEEAAAERVRVSLMSEVVPGESIDDQEVTTAFGYLFPQLTAEFPAHHLIGEEATVRAALQALGEALAEDPAGRPATRRSRGSTPTGVSSSTTT